MSIGSVLFDKKMDIFDIEDFDSLVYNVIKINLISGGKKRVQIV